MELESMAIDGDIGLWSHPNPESRIMGKVSVDEGWDRDAVNWCVLSWPGSMMETGAVQIDENTSAMDPTLLL